MLPSGVAARMLGIPFCPNHGSSEIVDVESERRVRAPLEFGLADVEEVVHRGQGVAK